jgi:hypothetical protein
VDQEVDNLTPRNCSKFIADLEENMREAAVKALKVRIRT